MLRYLVVLAALGGLSLFSTSAHAQSFTPQEITALKNILKCVEYVPSDADGQPAIIVGGGGTGRDAGCNLRIVNSTGNTNTANRRGNLIVGYNPNSGSYSRLGSHNVVTGEGHGYTGSANFIGGAHNFTSAIGGGLIGGWDNRVEGNGAVIVGGANSLVTSTAQQAALLGGWQNIVRGLYSAIVSGVGNEITGVEAISAAVVGGSANLIHSNNFSAIVGGSENLIMSGSPYSVVVGGESNAAFTNPHITLVGGYSNYGGGAHATAVGGSLNSPMGTMSLIAGGYNNQTAGQYSSVTGGAGNNASGTSSLVAGGYSNAASGTYANVTGGASNTASGYASTVSGGQTRSVTGSFNWRGGGSFQTN